MKIEKIVGYALLFIGLILIAFSIFSMYSVFTGSSKAPLLIKMNDVKISSSFLGEIVLIEGETLSYV
ncbi:MAG: hypothetical protein QW272_05325 [Candidatus Methanomethylicaceae archaeon]